MKLRQHKSQPGVKDKSLALVGIYLLVLLPIYFVAANFKKLKTAGTYQAPKLSNLPLALLFLSIIIAILSVWEFLELKWIKLLPLNQKNNLAFQTAPGANLYKLCRLLLPKLTFVEVVEPQISDMREEYFSAINDGRLQAAQFGVIRDHFWLIGSLILLLPSSIIGELKKSITSRSD